MSRPIRATDPCHTGRTGTGDRLALRPCRGSNWGGQNDEVERAEHSLHLQGSALASSFPQLRDRIRELAGRDRSTPLDIGWFGRDSGARKGPRGPQRTHRFSRFL
jgi:hypothetical protein